jgi:hypothetical protein
MTVVDTGDGWSAVEGGVSAVVVVGVEECGECVGAVLAAGEGACVDPFVGHGAVEAFGFAVGLWPVGAGEAGFGAEFGAGLVPGLRRARPRR